MSAVLSLKPSYYEALKRLTLELAGINLGQNHEFLIETRLSALARKEGYDSLLPMIEELFSSGQTRLAVHVVSALLERDTQFNHERESLDDILRTALPSLHRLFKGTTLRILSYGCSSGQEPYSIAMALEKNMDLFPGLKYQIVGVDYPSVALDRARSGRYTHFDVQRGLPIKDLITYFDRSAEDWVVKESLREKIEFKDFHLLSNLESLGEFHLVVFRNRLAQYSAPAQIRVLRELASVVRELGYLVLGRSEGVAKLNFGLDKIDGLAHVLCKREVVVEAPVDPTIKIPNGRTTFDGAKRRIKRARSELSEMRPTKENTQVDSKFASASAPKLPQPAPKSNAAPKPNPAQIPQPDPQHVRPNETAHTAGYVSAPIAPPRSPDALERPKVDLQAEPKPGAEKVATSVPARVTAPKTEPPRAPSQRRADKKAEEAAEIEALEFELETLFNFEDMSQRRQDRIKS